MCRATDPGIRTRAFIVGCARSGTTLLQSLLAAHPRITSFPESHFFSWIKRVESQEAHERLGRFAAEARLAVDGLLPEEPFGDSMDYVPIFVQMLDRSAQCHGSDVWVEKTPVHLHHLDEILQSVLDAKFVHILRNGVDTIRSLHHATQEYPEAWGGKRSIRRCARRWVRDIGLSLDVAGNPQHHVLRFETLTRQPESTLEAVCRFLEIPFESSMVEQHARASRDVVLSGEEWKAGVRKAITPRGPSGLGVETLDIPEELRARVRAAERRLEHALPLVDGPS